MVEVAIELVLHCRYVDELLSETRWREIGNLLNTREYRLYPPVLSPDQLRQMIEKSAIQANFSVADDLVEALRRDLHEWQHEDWPPVFGMVLEEIVAEWKRNPRERVLDVALYDRIGGLAGVVRRLTEHATDDTEGLDRLLSLLVRVDHSGRVTKRRIGWAAAGREEKPLLRQLVQQRLVRDEGGLELAHDILFREWNFLREWIAVRREDLDVLSDLEHSASFWSRRDRNTTELLPAERLDRADQVLRRSPAREAETPLLREFVAASQTHRDEEAFVHAIDQADARVLKRLLKKGVRLSAPMIAKVTYPAMYYAMRPDQAPVAPESRREIGTRTAFRRLTRDEGPTSLEYFDTADVSGRVNKGFQVQHFAALAGQLALLKRLKARGLDPHALTVGHSTPFSLIVHGGAADDALALGDRNGRPTPAAAPREQGRRNGAAPGGLWRRSRDGTVAGVARFRRPPGLEEHEVHASRIRRAAGAPACRALAAGAGGRTRTSRTSRDFNACIAAPRTGTIRSSTCSWPCRTSTSTRGSPTGKTVRLRCTSQSSEAARTRKR